MSHEPQRRPVIPPSMASASDEAHYSPAVRAGGLLFISGQTGVDEQAAAASPEAEARLAFRRLSEVLEHAGLTMDAVVSLTTYHLGDAALIHSWFPAVRDEFLRAPWPAWTAIGVASLAEPGARLEIAAVGLCPD